MISSPKSFGRSSQTTLVEQMVEEAIPQLSDQQRIKTARRLVAGIEEPHCAYGLLNLSELCREIGGQLMRQVSARGAD